MHKNRLAALGLAAGLLGGGVAGIAFGVPGFAGAQTSDTTVTADSTAAAAPADKGQWLNDALAPLVSIGTITQAQADAVIAALEAARPAHDHHGGPGFRGGPGNLEAAATAIGITVDELRTALQGGQSLADVAQSKGVDPGKVVDALVADMQARIAEKVASGRVTQEQADEMLASVNERTQAFVNGEAPPPGGGHHGPGGPGGPGPDGPPPASDQAPAESSTNA